MFHEKMIYYRKKNMLTQEELADKIGVSRQTITKWETGLILPNLEYLIDLSELFGVTIDSLVKEDDCQADEKNITDQELLSEFLVTAKRSTYAKKMGKIESSRVDSHDYFYQEGDYQYYDSFFGSFYFSGQEIVYHHKKVCWSMNYYGKVLSQEFSGDFLKEALLHLDIHRPLRGPELYIKGEYTYMSHIEGNLDMFHGYEEIYYQAHKIYEGYIHGGSIE